MNPTKQSSISKAYNGDKNLTQESLTGGKKNSPAMSSQVKGVRSRKGLEVYLYYPPALTLNG
jgi:hypothetical protein